MKYGIKIIWTPLWKSGLDKYWIKSPRGHENWDTLAHSVPKTFDDLNAAYRSRARSVGGRSDPSDPGVEVYSVVEEYP